MNSDSESEDKLVGGLFGPSDDEEEEECIVKYDTYERSFFQDNESEQPKLLTLALVKKHHSLWAEYVYNAARVVADMIDQNIIECRGKSCLELGAGAGLPGIMAALVGASTTVISDYGTSVDRSLIQAIDMNILSHNQYLSTGCKLVGEPYVWGNDVEPLTGHTGCGKFDVIFMADLIFNRSEHRKLLWTARECLNPRGGVVWVTFSHHDPQKKQLDLNFFTLAREEFGFSVTARGEQKRKSYPFTEGDGLDDERGYVYIVTLTFDTPLEPPQPSP